MIEHWREWRIIICNQTARFVSRFHFTRPCRLRSPLLPPSAARRGRSNGTNEFSVYPKRVLRVLWTNDRSFGFCRGFCLNTATDNGDLLSGAPRPVEWNCSSITYALLTGACWFSQVALSDKQKSWRINTALEDSVSPDTDLVSRIFDVFAPHRYAKIRIALISLFETCPEPSPRPANRYPDFPVSVTGSKPSSLIFLAIPVARFPPRTG